MSFDGNAGLLTGYTVVTCVECGFIYADGVPGPAAFERYYRNMSKHEPDRNGLRIIPPYKQHNIDLVTLPLTERLPNRSARILDVGVGNGETLMALRELGYTNLTGLDPSPRTAEVAQRHHGLRVLNIPVSHLRSVSERFDVILLSGVLEHLRDLRPTLLLLKSLLAQDGRMCIAVPDAARFADCVESPYQFLSVEHINFFTLRSLRAVFACIGMDLQDSWQATALLGAFKEPILHAMFEPGSAAAALPHDPESADTMVSYIAASGRFQASLMLNVAALVGAGEKVIVWGAGSLTMHLLSDPHFSQLNIVAFTDANANYWDKTIRGVRVIPPDRVRDFNATILIVSYSYEDEIYAEIRERYQLANCVVRLFGANQSERPGYVEEVQYG